MAATLALALFSLASCQFYGIKRRGFMNYLRSFVEPVAIMFPMNILEELVKIFSLSVRLFGNLFGGDMVVASMFTLIPFVVPTPVMLLEVLFGFIQALVFAMLTSVYVATAMGHH